jgi:hypothetical protein
VITDGADDGEAYLPLALHEPRLGRVGLVRHAQVGAQHVDAYLPLLGPVIGEVSHRVHPGEADRGLVMAELLGRFRVPLGELVCVRAV